MPKKSVPKKPGGSAGGSTASNTSGRGYSSAAAYDPRTGKAKSQYDRGNQPASEMGRGAGVHGGATAMSAAEYAARKGMAQGNQDWAYGRQLVGQLPSYVDPLNGASIMDLLTAGSGSAGRVGGGGGYGSSGGSAAATIDPSLLSGSLSMQAQAVDDSYNAREAVLRKLMAEQAGIYDTQGSALAQANQGVLSGLMAREDAANQMRAAQAQRIQEIVANLGNASRGAADATAGAYGAAGSQLDQMASLYADLQAKQNAGANQLTAAFGGPNAAVEGNAVQALAAARGLNLQLGAGAAASYAGRQSVYGGLQADANMADKQGYDSVMRNVADARTGQAAKYASDQAALAAARSQGMSQYEMQLAQLAADRQQAAIQAAKERAQLALQYGVQL